MTRITTFISSSLAVVAACACSAQFAAAEPPPTAAEVPAPPAASPAAAVVLPPAPTPLIGPPTEGGLTSDHVARRALDTSHELRARSEQSVAADYAIDQANAACVPRLTGQARYTRLSSIDQPSLGTLIGAPPGTRPGPIDEDTPLVAVPPSFPVLQNQYSLSASLQIPLSDYFLNLPQLKAAAEHDARAAALQREASQSKVATEARMAYYGWARARLQADVTVRALQQAEAHLEDAEAAFATGSASKADVLRVQSQVANAQLAKARAASAVELYAERLRVVMHESSVQAYEVGEDLRGPVQDGALGDEHALVAQVRRVMFQNGMATSVELTDAENEVSRAQLELIGAHIDRRIAGVRLAYVISK